MLLYLCVFVAALLVDIVPFFGPPAWTVMVFLQMRYQLNIWWVLVAGVSGSTVGRYILSMYISAISGRFISKQKTDDIVFIGTRLSHAGWKAQLFVLLYTLMPLPSTPLFTATGIARIRPVHILPAFFAGKFSSDMLMVFTGDYVAKNADALANGYLSWKSVTGSILGIVMIALFFFIDWRTLLVEKKFTLNFNIWK